MGLVAAIGYARIYLGVHYLSDVVAGYSAGLIGLYVCVTRIAIRRARVTWGPDIGSLLRRTTRRECDACMRPLPVGVHSMRIGLNPVVGTAFTLILATASSLAAQATSAPMPICKDGTTSTVAGRGACSGHQGVDAKATSAAKKAAAKAAKAAAATTKAADKAADKSADAAKATAKTVDKAADKTTAAAKTKPSTANVPNSVAAPGGGNGKVWVNTKSGVFHREGDEWYGKTKQGKYMTESEAIKAGYRAEKGTPTKKP